MEAGRPSSRHAGVAFRSRSGTATPLGGVPGVQPLLWPVCIAHQKPRLSLPGTRLALAVPRRPLPGNYRKSHAGEDRARSPRFLWRRWARPLLAFEMSGWISTRPRWASFGRAPPSGMQGPR